MNVMRRMGRAGRAAAAVLASAAMLACAACGAVEPAAEPAAPESPEESAGAITVAASVNPWGSLAAEIGGDDVEVTSVSSSLSDAAHGFDPDEAGLEAVASAEVVVVNGAGYDSWASRARGADATLVSAAQIVGAMDGDNPHLWFSKDARRGMAKELADAFAKARPSRRKTFQRRLKAWTAREDALDEAMDAFAASHEDLIYAATEPAVYYLMSDLSFEDVTPKAWEEKAVPSEGGKDEALESFRDLFAAHGASVLADDVQTATEETKAVRAAAEEAQVPVVDVTERMPQEYETLVDWVGALAESLFAAVDPDYGRDDACEGEAPDGDTDDATADDGERRESCAADGDGQADGTSDDAASGDDAAGEGE